jgi:hypothetical protein
VIVDIALEYPTHGQVRTSNELRKMGVMVSSGGVHSIWKRNNLNTLDRKLKALEKKVAAEGIILTEAQLQELEKQKSKREALGEIETEHPGFPGSQDTYYVGNFKGIGKQEIPLMRILTDRGTEYCGTLENHAYELFLSIEGIDHSKIRAYTPQTNGICERFHKTMKNEFYDSALRKKIYTSLEKLQTDVDSWLQHYNHERPHSRKYCLDKTPMQTFNEGKRIAIDRSNQLAYHKNASDNHYLYDNSDT